MALRKRSRTRKSRHINALRSTLHSKARRNRNRTRRNRNRTRRNRSKAPRNRKQGGNYNLQTTQTYDTVPLQRNALLASNQGIFTLQEAKKRNDNAFTQLHRIDA